MVELNRSAAEIDATLVRVDNMEDGAEVNPTAAEIKTDYESNTDTNAYTDAEKAIVSTQSGTNTGDQDLSGLQDELAEGPFVDGDKTKLNGIETGAQVNTGDATSIQGEGVTSATPTEGKILVYRTDEYVLEDKPTSTGNPAWGEITGTVANQTDIQAELDAKQDVIATSDDITEGTTNLFLTSAQEAEITANTAKISYTDAAEVALNTAKISFDSTSSTRLANTSGTNTGDQDISGIGTNATAISTKIEGDSVAKITSSTTEPTSPTTGDLWVDLS